MECNGSERVFDVKDASRPSQPPVGSPATAGTTLSDVGRLPEARRAADHARGRYPVAVSPGRSRNMQAIRRRDTLPERMLRSSLHAAGFRYRCDLLIKLDTIRVRPDIVFTRRKLAVFVDGCFWHCCPEHGRQPAVNDTYWSPKLQGNVDRDRRNDDALLRAGWAVIRIWEHESVEVAFGRVANKLGVLAAPGL